MVRHFVSMSDLSRLELLDLLDLAASLQSGQRTLETSPPLHQRTLAMIFEKPSLRTRVTFETAMTQLGGHAIYLAPTDIGLGQREPVRDVAKNLSRWVDGITARTFAHRAVEELAEASDVPVINALSEREHPCQVLADLLTLKERFGGLENLSLAFVGDGNNICHSLLLAAGRLGLDFRWAGPEGYQPDAEIVARAREEAEQNGGRITLTNEPAEAVSGVQAVYTDVWASMGQEGERQERLKRFEGYQVTAELMGQASGGAVFLHCLPAHRGEEVAVEVIDGPASVVFDQAENRLHAQKALLLLLLGSES